MISRSYVRVSSAKPACANSSRATLPPFDAHLRMQLLVTLRGGDQRWKGAAVVPGHSAQAEPVHACCSRKLGIRTFCPLVAEIQAASIISIAATPRDAGDRLQVGSMIESNHMALLRINLSAPGEKLRVAVVLGRGCT